MALRSVPRRLTHIILIVLIFCSLLAMLIRDRGHGLHVPGAVTKPRSHTPMQLATTTEEPLTLASNLGSQSTEIVVYESDPSEKPQTPPSVPRGLRPEFRIKVPAPGSVGRPRHKYKPRVKQLPERNYWVWVGDICHQEDKAFDITRHHDLRICPCVPAILKGNITIKKQYMELVTWPALHHDLKTSPGGHWKPTNCAPRRKIAVIVPYRDRESHLRAFLSHMHPVLQRQMVEYRIFIVEQRYPYRFNKGVMMNIGFLVASTMFPMDCLIFHDVDMLMENDMNMAICGPNPLHMGAYVNKFSYRLGYSTLIGGVVSITPKQFLKINGYSSTFFGWGGEDDNFSGRIRTTKMYIVRGPRSIAGYTMLHHHRDVANKGSDGAKGFRYLPGGNKRDGLTTTKYEVKEIKSYPLYTWIYADILPTEPQRRFFTLKGNFRDIAGSCDWKMDIPPVALSLVTCQWVCLESPSCVAIEYHSNPIKNSYCFVMTSMCEKITHSDLSNIYVKS